MKKIIDWIVKIGKDKWIHFTVCLIIALIAGIVTKWLCPDLSKAGVMCAAWTVGFVAGLTKEICDEIKSGSSDAYDWAADFIGSTLGAVIVLLLV